MIHTYQRQEACIEPWHIISINSCNPSEYVAMQWKRKLFLTCILVATVDQWLSYRFVTDIVKKLRWSWRRCRQVRDEVTAKSWPIVSCRCNGIRPLTQRFNVKLVWQWSGACYCHTAVVLFYAEDKHRFWLLLITTVSTAPAVSY